MNDYYDVLQVSPRAEPEVIQAAYRRLARKHHPDVYKAPDADERMRALNDAFEVLSDPVRRRQYDQTRTNQENRQRYGPPPPPPPRPQPGPSRASGRRKIWPVAGVLGGLLFVSLSAIGVALAFRGEGNSPNDPLAANSASRQFSNVPSLAAPASTGIGSSTEWDSNAIWTLGDVQALYRDCSVDGELVFSPDSVQDFACVAYYMGQHGAKPDAIAFFTSSGLFLDTFREVGVVDYGVASAPWLNMDRPNNLLLNGEPAIVNLAGLLGTGTLYQRRGDDILFPEYASLVNELATEGGQVFTFDVPAAPCRACEATGKIPITVETVGNIVFSVTEGQLGD